MPTTGFDHIEGLTITETITRSLAVDRIEQPTEAQVQAIGAILAGRHTLLRSGTGTGKTLAYVLPMLQRLRGAPDDRAVVIAPGAELAMQALRVINAYKDEEVTTGAAISTTSQARQRKRVQRSTQVVVGTPERVLELVAAGKLKRTRLVVLDELESILRSRGSDALLEWLSRSEPKVQLVVATATMNHASEAFVARFMSEDCTRIEPADNPLQQAITHRFVRLGRGMAREIALARFIQENHCRPVIVFISDARHQGHLFHYLNEHGLSTVTLSHERTKDQRLRGLEAFRRGEARILLTSDETARGLDVPGVPWVLHYGMPPSANAYVHRAGRTGRAGEPGTSVVFVDDEARDALRNLGRAIDVRFEPFYGHRPASRGR
jgi:ATP-dependent RNA helicase DeaD